MLRIYNGRESLQKDKFIFDQIREAGAAAQRTLLLVPDQFTLQAERDAFTYLGVKGFMDLDVVSVSRLGSKVLSETGGGKTSMINKYGRHMLLTKILREKAAELDLYKGMEKKQSFIEMVNNFLSELKQYGAEPQLIREIAGDLDDGTFLKRKLKDIAVIFDEYEEQIAGKYIDTEDYVSLYADKISESEKIAGSVVWIYGFDAFTPKNIEVIGKLMTAAKEVNLVITDGAGERDADLFSLARRLTGIFIKMAEEASIPWEKISIPDTYMIGDKKPAIRALEQEIYALPVKPQMDHEGITIVKAANFYSEAETAAAKVLSLVRDRGYKYNEIILICNDLETRGTIVKRVFKQYGIELFLDRKQSVLHSPASVFMLSLLELADGKYNTEAIFRLLKTDLTGLPWNKVEMLENYARKYRIKGGRWTAEFKNGQMEYGEEVFAEIQQLRQQVIGPVKEFSKEFKGAATVKESVQILYKYMTEVYDIPGKLEALMARQEELGMLSASAETAQIWGYMVDVLDQFVDIIGDEEIPADSFSDILRAGLEAIELGLLPPSADGLIMGTMQRTRSSHVKAMLILGANEGLLPAAADSNSLLSEDEKKRLASKDIEICKVDDIRRQEERMAIYKNLSKASQQLWISYSASDENGGAINPSQLLNTIHDIFPMLEEEADIISTGKPVDLLQAPDAGKEHLAGALRAAVAGGTLDPAWKKALGWYAENGQLSNLKAGISWTGKQENLSKELVKKLYRNDAELDALLMSPSRLENFSKCPFAHMIQFGLRPEEQRVFEVGSREIGDAYHNCFMELFRWLSDDTVDICDENSKWSRITRKECDDKILEIFEKEAAEYKEGLMQAGEEEKYRTDRIKEICCDIGWVLVEHVKEGRVHTMGLEKEFGRNGELPPITVETESGKVLIEGKIDRIDMLDDDKIKIIDYKTGDEKFNIEEARAGYRLQLMLYLRAAMEGKYDPAAVFYFLINQPKIDVNSLLPDEMADVVDQELMKNYKMKGAMINDESIIRGIAGDFEKESRIVSLQRTKTGYSDHRTGTLVDEEAFHQLRRDVDKKIDQLCKSLLDGENPAHPMKTKERSACTFCQFKSICQFDTDFEDCNYEMI